MTDIIVTKDKEFIRHLIFDGVDEDADKVREILFGKKLYASMAGLGKYLQKQYGGVHQEDADEIAKQLEDLLYHQETNHVHIVMQQVFDMLGARVIPKERWDKLKNEQ
jgi:hypothetical protein